MENSLIPLAEAPAETMPYSGEPKELSTLVQWFESAERETAEERDKSNRDRDYYDGIQLTDEERQELAKRKQPPIIVNLIRREIDYLSGLEKSQRVDPKAYPRTPNDQDAAYVATEALRFVADETEYDQYRSNAWRNMLIPGVGGVIMEWRDGKIQMQNADYDYAFWDYHSARHGFSDARYLGLVKWLDKDTVIELYGEKAAPIFDQTMSDVSPTDHFDDKPRFNVWGDKTRARIRIVQMFYRCKGEWYEAHFTKAGEFINEITPYVDEDGNTYCRLLLQSAYVDRNNRRYGEVRSMIDPQDDYNKRRSKLTHLLNVNQVVADEDAVADPENIRQLMAQPDAFIEKRPGSEFRIERNLDLAMGQIQIMQEAEAQISRGSVKNAMIGSGDQSGKAKQAQQQAAMVEVGDLLDRLRNLDQRVYQVMWFMIKQFWTEPMAIRVTDNADAPQFLGINVPAAINMDGTPFIQNPVAEMNVDLRIDDAPDMVTLEAEEFQTFATMFPQLIGAPPQWAKLLVEISPSFKAKPKVMAMLDEMIAASQQPNPMQMQAQQTQMAQQQADVEETVSKTAKNYADAQEKQARVFYPTNYGVM